MQVVVMGVAGAGKSTVGAALAARLGVPFGEGDALHPAANVAKMTAGHPLDDADRAPWLDRIAAWLVAHPAGVVACSALKRAYRDRLREAAPDTWCVLLAPPVATLQARLAARQGHFMPPALLASQLATLEPLAADERGITIAADAGLDATLDAVLARLPGRHRSG